MPMINFTSLKDISRLTYKSFNQSLISWLMSCNRSWSSSVIDVPVSNPSKPPSDVDFATNDDDGLIALPLSFKYLTLSFDVVKFLYLLSWMRAPSPEDLREEEGVVDASRATNSEVVDADATAHRRDDRDGDAEEDVEGVEGVVVTTNMIIDD